MRTGINTRPSPSAHEAWEVCSVQMERDPRLPLRRAEFQEQTEPKGEARKPQRPR